MLWPIPRESEKILNQHAITGSVCFAPNEISRIEISRPLKLSRSITTAPIPKDFLGWAQWFKHPPWDDARKQKTETTGGGLRKKVHVW